MKKYEQIYMERIYCLTDFRSIEYDVWCAGEGTSMFANHEFGLIIRGVMTPNDKLIVSVPQRLHQNLYLGVLIELAKNRRVWFVGSYQKGGSGILQQLTSSVRSRIAEGVIRFESTHMHASELCSQPGLGSHGTIGETLIHPGNYSLTMPNQKQTYERRMGLPPSYTKGLFSWIGESLPRSGGRLKRPITPSECLPRLAEDLYTDDFTINLKQTDL